MITRLVVRPVQVLAALIAVVALLGGMYGTFTSMVLLCLLLHALPHIDDKMNEIARPYGKGGQQ